MESLQGSEAIRVLVEGLRNQVVSVDNLLLNSDSKTLPDTQRDRYIDQKTLYKWMISFFDVETQRKQIEDELSKN